MSTLGKAFLHETGAESLKNLRAPEFLLPTLLMPVAFYSLFGIAMTNGPGVPSYMLATYGVFAVMGPSIFGFGVGVATERDRGWLKLKRAAPAPALSYLAAKIASTLLFAGVALLVLYMVAGFFGGVVLEPQIWGILFGLHLIASIPMLLIGLVLGFSLGANGAVAVCNVVFLTLAVLGGLWMPIFMFPSFLQAIAQYLPSYHLGQLALSIVDQSRDYTPMENATAIGVTTAILFALATLAWARQR